MGLPAKIRTGHVRKKCHNRYRLSHFIQTEWWISPQAYIQFNQSIFLQVFMFQFISFVFKRNLIWV